RYCVDCSVREMGRIRGPPTAARRFLGVCHIRQSLHSSALVVSRKMRVLARNRVALMPYDLACDKVGNTRCFEHRHRTVTQTVERDVADRARPRAALAGAPVAPRLRLD